MPLRIFTAAESFVMNRYHDGLHWAPQPLRGVLAMVAFPVALIWHITRGYGSLRSRCRECLDWLRIDMTASRGQLA